MKGEEKHETVEVVVKKVEAKVVYVALPDDIIGSLIDGKDREHNIRLALVVMTDSEDHKKKIESHFPLVIHSVLEVVEVQKYSDLMTYNGKKALRTLIQKRLSEALKKHKTKITAVLFTKFVMD